MRKFWERIKFLGLVLGHEKRSALVVCALIVLATVVECFGLYMILPILHVILEGGLHGKLASVLNPFLSIFPQRFLLPFLCLLFLLLVILKFGFTLTRIYFTRSFVWKIRLWWLNRVFEKYLKTRYSYITSHKQGELFNNLIHETHRGAICLSQLMEFLAKVVLLIALYVTLLVMNWQITLMISIFIGGLFLITHRISKNYARKFGRRRIELNQQLSSWGAEGIGAVRQIKTYSLEAWFKQQFIRIAQKLCGIEIRFDVFRAVPLYVGETTIAFLLVAGIFYLSFYTDIALKSFLPTLGLFLVVGQRLVGNISNLAELRLQILSLMPSVSLTYSLSEHAISEEDLSTGREFNGLEQDIVFQDVTFSYDQGKPVLWKLNLIIPRKKITALVGSSGSGKSTIADLLLGLYKPQSGRILINGRDSSEWKLSSWRDKMGYVSQEPYLFNMSIRDNIALGCPGASEGSIAKAAKEAYAHEFIINFPQGYDTVVGDRGIKLSGGERQRIAIARAIIRTPDFLIFDEATSALDLESEKLVQKAIEEIRQEKTILIIAHRASATEHADIIYDLDKMNEVNLTKEKRQISASK